MRTILTFSGQNKGICDGDVVVRYVKHNGASFRCGFCSLLAVMDRNVAPWRFLGERQVLHFYIYSNCLQQTNGKV